MLMESPHKFRQTVSDFAEDMVISNYLCSYFHIFFLATKISAYLKWNLCLYFWSNGKGDYENLWKDS